MENNSIGKKIKNIRLSLGMTAEEFGKMFTPPAAKSIVSRWEKGKSLPNPKRTKKIAELGNTTVEDLLGEEKYLNKENDFLSENIKNVRISLGMTMEQFIEAIDGESGKGRSGVVNNWETGKNFPNKKRLRKIAELGGMPVGTLLGGKEYLNEESNFLSENIKNIRLSNHCTMESFGKLIGAPKSAVNNWEKGRNAPSLERLEKIAELGNTTVNELLYSNSQQKSLIVWFKNGQTAKFNDAKITGHGSLLTFTYFSQSDLVERDAVFNSDAIVGYSFG
jgi:transcriptional regulator with XRE-family HTH domain